MKFDQAVGGGGACVDNICSDGNGDYVDGEDRVGVDAGGRSQPNPAAGIHLGMSRKNGRGRQVFLDIKCLPIHSFPATDGPPHALINQCGLLSDLEFDFGSVVEGILGHLPDCEVGNLFCDLGAMVRPYKAACPELLNGECPDVFTMRNQTIQLMSFKLGSPGLLSKLPQLLAAIALLTLGVVWLSTQTLRPLRRLYAPLMMAPIAT